MTFSTDRLRSVLTDLENRAKYSVLVSTIFGGIISFVVCYTGLINNPTFVDRIVFIFVGAALGSIHGIDTKRKIQNQSTIVASLLELHDLKNQSNNQAIPLEEVQIPSQPKLPDIPSKAVPAEVKEALKGAKGKGKPTRLPPKRKPKTVPPAQA